jgi:hypothetical protein
VSASLFAQHRLFGHGYANIAQPWPFLRISRTEDDLRTPPARLRLQAPCRKTEEVLGRPLPSSSTGYGPGPAKKECVDA